MAVLWFGARQVIDGKLTAGELSSFIVYAIFVSGNVGQLAGVFASLMQVCPYFPPCAAQRPHTKQDARKCWMWRSNRCISQMWRSKCIAQLRTVCSWRWRLPCKRP